jgi:hypothetical protein
MILRKKLMILNSGPVSYHPARIFHIFPPANTEKNKIWQPKNSSAIYTMKLRTDQILGIVSHHHYHLPPWIRSFELFRHLRVAIFSWGVHEFFSLEVCRWGLVSELRCCLFFQDGWSNFVSVRISRIVFQRSLVIFLWLNFLCCLVLCIL